MLKLFKEVADRTNLEAPFWISGAVKLLSSSDSKTFEINLADQEIYVYGIDISAIDADGKDILRDTGVAKDLINITIKDNQDRIYTNGAVSIGSLLSSSNSIRWPGMTFKKNVRYMVEISASPAGVLNGTPEAKGSYPLNIRVTFNSNKIMSSAELTTYIQELNAPRG